MVLSEKELKMNENMRTIVGLIRKLANSKRLPATIEMVVWLRKVAKQCDAIDAGRSEQHLVTLLITGAPITNMPKSNMLATEANRSACYRLKSSLTWLEGDDTRDLDGGPDFGMVGMLISDAADHLEVCRKIRHGASKKIVYNALWQMDTASRDYMSNKVWDWIGS
jgi:hypothetical protein